MVQQHLYIKKFMGTKNFGPGSVTTEIMIYVLRIGKFWY